MKTWKVLHCPTTVGGNPQALSKAMDELGLDSASLALEQNVFNYKADFVLWRKGEFRIVKEIKRITAILHAFSTFDVVHYNFGTTLAMPL